MAPVLLASLGLGVGLVGVCCGLRRQRQTLDGVLAETDVEVAPAVANGVLRRALLPRFGRRAALSMAAAVRRRGFDRYLATRLAMCEVSLEELCGRCIVGAAVGVSAPALLSVIAAGAGAGPNLFVPVWAGLLAGTCGALMPLWRVNVVAEERRRHAVRVVTSFLDLVVLGLAGGMGIEGALFCATEVGENHWSKRLRATLILSRDSGTPPWIALRDMGSRLGIPELVDVASAAALAGTEGARVRATLAARAAAIRKHELAEAESEANAVTERLFLPGTILLVGFLLFVGYPAVARIMSGL